MVNMPNSASWKIAKLFALIVTAIGLFTIWCWIKAQYSIDFIHPFIFEMSFNTALCFSFAGLVYLLQAEGAAWSKILQLILGCLLLTIGLLVLLQYLFHISLGIDQLFVKVQFTEGIKNPGRMSSLTATAFTTAGLAIFMLQVINSIRSVYISYLLILTLPLMAALGVVQNQIFNLVNGKLDVNRIAYHTSLCLVLFATILWIHWYHATKKINFEFTDVVIGNLIKLSIFYFVAVVLFSTILVAFPIH